jgi:hypothetical protein
MTCITSFSFFGFRSGTTEDLQLLGFEWALPRTKPRHFATFRATDTATRLRGAPEMEPNPDPEVEEGGANGSPDCTDRAQLEERISGA